VPQAAGDSVGVQRGRTLRKRAPSAGFTLIELLVVVVIIGVLAAMAVPNFLRAMEKARISRMAADLKTFESAFLDFSIQTGDFPPDSHLEQPYHLANGIGIEAYVPVGSWVAKTPFGGNYNWEGPDSYPYAGISLFASSATAEQMQKLDALLDDGDLTQGAFRRTPNDRYTYIVDE